MVSKLEKQFFDTFGIEPKQACGRTGVCNNYVNYNDCNGCNYYKYPAITDRILLELICILTRHFDYADQNWLTKCNDIKELKVSVLRLLLLCTTNIIEKCKHQVQALFKER